MELVPKTKQRSSRSRNLRSKRSRNIAEVVVGAVRACKAGDTAHSPGLQPRPWRLSEDEERGGSDDTEYLGTAWFPSRPQAVIRLCVCRRSTSITISKATAKETSHVPVSRWPRSGPAVSTSKVAHNGNHMPSTTVSVRRLAVNDVFGCNML